MTDLYELLEAISPGKGEEHKFFNLKSSFVTYELKKTKGIKKDKQKEEKKMKDKRKLIIKTKI